LPPFSWDESRAETQRLARIGTYAALAGLGVALLPGMLPSARGASGGAGVAPAPVITGAHCVSTRARPCIDTRWVRPGDTIEVAGRYLAGAKEVLFYGRKGKADDAHSPTRRVRPGRAVAKVPAKVRSGPIAVVSGAGVLSRRWRGLVVDEPAQPLPSPAQKGPLPVIGTAVSQPRKIFYRGLEKAVFTYQVTNSQPVDVTVNLVRLADRRTVRTWRQPQVAPGAPQKVVWDGSARGRAQAEGYYAFQVVAATATGSQATTAPESRQNAVELHGHMFPVAGRHDYGGAGAQFGAGRGGRSHQGHDVFARCGTPLVAARAGKVIYSGYHRLAGYYVVIHGSGSGQDYVYMHLNRPALFSTGDQVYTGQPLGEVGQSGNARGCHLHFELWSAPGWYRGGRPRDPLPDLRRWDGFS
jgi:murein DD-endopeptidase MepM/ murein hydrolase activator NlpD